MPCGEPKMYSLRNFTPATLNRKDIETCVCVPTQPHCNASCSGMAVRTMSMEAIAQNSEGCNKREHLLSTPQGSTRTALAFKGTRTSLGLKGASWQHTARDSPRARLRARPERCGKCESVLEWPEMEGPWPEESHPKWEGNKG